MDTTVKTEKKVLLYGDIVSVRQALAEAKVNCKKMPGSMAFAIMKNVEALDKPTKALEKKRQELLMQYVSKDEKGELKISQPTPEEVKNGKRPEWVYEPGKKEECMRALDEMLKQEVVLDKPLRMIPYSVFEKTEIETSKFNHMGLFVELFVFEEHQ